MWLWRTDCFYSFHFCSLLSAIFAFSLLSVVVVSSFRGLLWYFVIERFLVLLFRMLTSFFSIGSLMLRSPWGRSACNLFLRRFCFLWRFLVEFFLSSREKSGLLAPSYSRHSVQLALRLGRMRLLLSGGSLLMRRLSSSGRCVSRLPPSGYCFGQTPITSGWP